MSIDPRSLWDHMRTGFWFTPLVLAACACGLAGLVLGTDVAWFGNSKTPLGLPMLDDVERIRDVLAIMVNATVTLLGLSFSLTIIAVTVASQQYGPRIVRSLLRSKGTQVVLGMFVGSFLYSVLVLAGSGHSDSVRLAVLLGMLMMLADVLALVWYLHHVARSVHPGRGLDSARREFIAQLSGPDLPRTQSSLNARAPEFHIRADRAGYVTVIDHSRIARLAAENDWFVEVLQVPGSYVLPGVALLGCWGDPAEDAAVLGRMREAVAIANERTAVQDPGLSLSQVVDVALRALSPGINDPNTAIAALHVLSQCLEAAGELDGADWIGAWEGTARLRIPRPSFRAFVIQSVPRILDAANDHAAVQNAVSRVLAMLHEVFADRPAAQQVVAAFRVARPRRLDLEPATAGRAAADGSAGR